RRHRFRGGAGARAHGPASAGPAGHRRSGDRRAHHRRARRSPPPSDRRLGGGAMSVQQLAGKRIGVAMSASHCNVGRAMVQLRRLRDEGAEIVPIISTNVRTTETRFGKPDHWITQIEQITGRLPLMTIPEVEPFGPQVKLDCLVIMPCTGNTMAKLANAINDTPVCMAAKAQMRNHRPVVLAVTTNDGL